nr:magnesium transporter MRS2-3-like [Coffea arabica]
MADHVDDVDFLTPKKSKKAGLLGTRRTWVLLDSEGNPPEVLEAGKHAIMRRTGLQTRDLRILDPLLGYPATLLSRERAIVVSLEHIKAIITAHEVILLNSKDPSVAPFVEELRLKIFRHHQAVLTPLGDNVDFYNLEEPQSRAFIASSCSRSPLNMNEGLGGSKRHIAESKDGPKLLPLEFVALEACLESACSCLENEVGALEKEVRPALNKLTSNISSLNLEQVQQIKGRLIPLTKRVQKVRDELESLLNDDQDMAGMYLTDKHIEWQLENSSNSSIDEEFATTDEEAKQPNMYDTFPLKSLLNWGPNSCDAGIQQLHNQQEHLFCDSNLVDAESSLCHTNSRRSSRSKQLHVGDLEMLLEAYFIQIDGTLNKLSTLREHMDDTEDYVNIVQDDKRNQLLQMVVMIMTATLVLGVFIAVEGIFGINIHIDAWGDKEYGTQNFLRMIGGGIAGTLLLYGVAIACYRHKRLL